MILVAVAVGMGLGTMVCDTNERWGEAITFCFGSWGSSATIL